MKAESFSFDQAHLRGPLRARPGRTGRRTSRRATVMVYVLGVLTLVALMGLILIAGTHGESKRVTNESTASSGQVAMNGVIRIVQEVLHRDIWGPTGQSPVPLSGVPADELQETNEPYDAPGRQDRWLHSAYPYTKGLRIANTYPSAVTEEDVLAWHRVSYLGADVIRTEDPNVDPLGSTTHAWAVNRRIADPSAGLIVLTSYGDSSLEGVEILQTPAPHTFDASGSPLPLVPGSTTNVTISEARAVWETVDKPMFDDADMTRRFPYFDTNADGAVDLYDADGDGVPDAPISFVVPIDAADPDAPERLYAAIRIVDHAGMLNVNTASSLQPTATAGPGDLTFDEAVPALQRRGRSATEFLLDEAAHPDDTFAGLNRTAGLMAYRWNTASAPSPEAYDRDVVRRKLVGGYLIQDYLLYGLSDEASLRHRGTLVPHSRKDDRDASACGYCRIDRALPGTLLWSRRVVGGSYNLSYEPRWNRLNANYVDAAYEGYDDTNGLGWRTLLQEDVAAAIRRPMFTTVSHEVLPPPPGVLFTDNGTPRDGSDDTVLGLAPQPVRFPDGMDPTLDLYMAWPVLDRANYPGLSDWMRVQPIDINLSIAGIDLNQTKELFIRYMAAAMYLALEGVEKYHGIWLADRPSTPQDESLNRQWLAWQFALNVADYRDSDSKPTVLQWVYQDPGGPGEQVRYLSGVEKQAFLTEAFAYLVTVGLQGSSLPGQDDTEFFAVELFVPPYWKIPIVDPDNTTQPVLYFRMPGATPDPGLLPLNAFARNGQAPILDGGPDGRYFVFCGDTSGAPGDIRPLALATFFTNPAFRIATDGDGTVELVYSPDGAPGNPRNHVLDVIDPALSGGRLAGGTAPGSSAWAHRPPVAPGETSRKAFSLVRSTTGWRFTTGWQVYTEADFPESQNLPTALRESLGQYNPPFDEFDDNIPESVWPAMVTTWTGDHEPLHLDGSGAFVPGFTSGRPYEAFDSVGEISRMLIVGPARLTEGPPPVLFDGMVGNVPATAFIARILDETATGDLPVAPGERIAAGRVDLSLWTRQVGGEPWSWRLMRTLTTQSHLFDGVDNDGDDPGDGSMTDTHDQDEGATVLYRVAGRINANTAPCSVLRSLPFMSLLPTAAEYTWHHNGGVPVADAAGEYLANPGQFWDFASAIVALREGRAVPLRLPDGAGVLQTVASADRIAGPGIGGGSEPTGPVQLKQVAEVMRLMGIVGERIGDASANANHSLYRIDRFQTDPALALWNHRLQPPNDYGPDLGGSTEFSPDFRYRNDNGVMDYVPIVLPVETAGNPYDSAGIRGRDVFLARWANLLTTRSDVFTAYIALIDEEGRIVRRAQVTLDRSECFREVPVDRAANPDLQRTPVLPKVLSRVETSYTDDMR